MTVLIQNLCRNVSKQAKRQPSIHVHVMWSRCIKNARAHGGESTAITRSHGVYMPSASAWYKQLILCHVDSQRGMKDRIALQDCEGWFLGNLGSALFSTALASLNPALFFGKVTGPTSQLGRIHFIHM